MVSHKKEQPDELNSLGREGIPRNAKLEFAEWIERYDVNLSALADRLDISRQQVYNIKSGKNSASLAMALAIYYISGGLVDMFSLTKDGDMLKEDLREYIKLTHSQNRAKIKRKNALVRYNLRKL